MHLSYKFGEVAQYNSDTNLYYEYENNKIYYYKDQSKVEIFNNDSLTRTIEDVKKVGFAGGFCVLTNEGKLYVMLFGASGADDLELDNVVDFVGCKELFNNNWDVALESTFLVVFFESGTKVYVPIMGNTALISVSRSFSYGTFLTFIPLSDLSVLVSKSAVYCLKSDGTYKIFSVQQAPIKTWVDAGYMYYTTPPESSEGYTSKRLILFFPGNYEYAYGVDLSKLEEEFETKPDGSYLDLEIDDRYTGNAITPVTQRSVEIKGNHNNNGVYFNDANYNYIKTSYSLQDPPQVITITDSNGLEIGAPLPHKFSANVPITEIEFRGTLYNSCHLIFYFSGLVQEQYLIAYKGTVPEFASVEIAGTTINVGERKSGFNIMGDFAIKINSIVSSPTLQGNFISKAGTTTPFTKIKFIDKNGNETEITDFNFATK